MTRYELTPQFDNAKSFCGKAHVTIEGDKRTLTSYETEVATVEGDKAIVYDTYSATTLRHIKEFLKQNGFKADTKKQILEYRSGKQ